MTNNIILLTDSYKITHAHQYPPNTETVYSYFESRGGKFNSTLFFGLNYYLKKYLSKPITLEDIDEADGLFAAHFGNKDFFNRKGWEHILKAHGGYLPVSIKAVPEGTIVPTKNVLMTIENTDPEAWWLTNHLETLLVQTWYGSTVATISMEMKKLILKYLRETGTPEDIDFKLHDFGFRGVSSVESAGIGGAAHLVNFKGTDTIAALIVARDFYGEEMAGFSIPASEHSTMTAWRRKNEKAAYENMLDQFPTGLVAVVSDSYDIFNACREVWGEQLREKVMNREGTVVIRPDSGVPSSIVPQVLEILGNKFGHTTNDKGFKVLDPHIRVIQGDGVDYEETGRILGAMKRDGWSADNVAFGMGGGLLQKLHRDTQMFAFKCSSITIDGEEHEVMKNPLTATWKSSKPGRLKLVDSGDERGYTTRKVSEEWPTPDLLVETFRDGKILVDPTFQEIRDRAQSALLWNALPPDRY